MSQRLIHVAAGAIADGWGRVLVARRPQDTHQGGLWEFPGGKLEPGETVQAGLSRELEEELGIRVVTSQPLIRIRHDYGDRRVLLDVHRVSRFAGEPQGREGQPLAWLRPEQMVPKDFPAADRPIINALRLPALYLITGQDPRVAKRFLQRLNKALEAGIRLVQLRAHGLEMAAYAALAQAAYRLCEQAGARLILNRAHAGLHAVPCHGLHFPTRLLLQLEARPAGADLLLGASCHNREQLRHAERLGLDYALLSPVLPTATHPAARPLGWGQFAALVEEAALPVYALGGLAPRDLPRVTSLYGQGVAAIRGLWPRDEG